MITIHSINQEGLITERLWDNVKCNFHTPEGERIEVQIEVPEEERQELRKMSHSSYNTCCETGQEADTLKRAYDAMNERMRFMQTMPTKSRNVISLRIQMGLSCNYKCQYCKQTTHTCHDSHSDLEDAKRFIERFAEICTTDRNEPINIQLWGGEPLLYWPVLTLLGEFLRKEFKHARITCLSNGSLIDEEKVKWFLEHKIILAISHDGPGQLDYRTGDCLAEGTESLKWLRYYAENCEEPLYFNAVITKNRYDLTGIIKHIKDIVGENVRVGFEGIVLVEDESQFDASTMFTDEDYQRMRYEIVEQMMEGNLNEVGMFSSKINTLIGSIVDPTCEITDDLQQKCSMDSPYNLSVDLKGNILACHSTPKRIGHIDNFEQASLEKINFVHWHRRKECRACPILTLCRGGCLAQDANAFYHSCNNEFNFHLIFFEAVFRLIFGEAIIAMEGIERPTKQDFLARAK